jgi:hypothetical protein
VTEAVSPQDREFGDELTCAVLRESRAASAGAILEALTSSIDDWTGGTCGDDLTALILKTR